MAKTHNNKHVQAAVEYALARNWSLEPGKGHCWGTLRCPHNDRACRCGRFCRFSVWSTPQNPENHAKDIIRRVDGCMYENGDE